MFNSGYKKEAMAELKRTGEEYKKISSESIVVVEELHKEKNKDFTLIKKVESYINNISNKPKELISKVEEISLNIKAFGNEIIQIQNEYKNVNLKSTAGIGMGIGTGTAVAAFAPTAAMAIATTFGTASTGTAIATLSGAAATNAALAWIGGGALVAGGGGMVAGEALLALAGPIGWAIGGTAVVGGALFASSKNKKAAEEAEDKTYIIKKETQKHKKIKHEVEGIKKQLSDLNLLVNENLYILENANIKDYVSTSEIEKNRLFELINETRVLSVKINSKLSTEL